MNGYIRLPAPQSGHRYCSACGECYPEMVFTLLNVCDICAGLPIIELVSKARQTAIRQYRTYPRRQDGKRPQAVPSEHKRCSCCHWVKPFGEFDGDSRRPGGMQAECKSCRKLRRTLRTDPTAFESIRDALRASAV